MIQRTDRLVLEELSGRPYPIPGLLHAWWAALRAGLRRLIELGVVELAGPTPGPAADLPLGVAPLVWDALRGGGPDRSAIWVRHAPVSAAVGLDDLVLPADLAAAVRRMTQGNTIWTSCP